ncbi:Fe-only nitrogenase accessory AnfO family protein [Anaeromicropila populeti]|uniref:Fe-only nitrogenase accessory protein AnfO n=1 Tax=Anaeromicropila populeti TaxID=37658 RepID=A0A1I6HUW1_9FIRM|nr:Fe-only nitrogenase accessory AnfO family protein [Anaeromicropila populeti]SFR58236.1 Fe-only nitrogenase accessory protein AnfO [Anaeromicropila populeti]
MNGKIAVLFNQENKMTDFSHIAKIKVFEKEQEWEIKKEFQAGSDLQEGIMVSTSAIREQCKKIVEELGDCSILIGTMITGLPFQVLDKQGFILLEAETFTTELLDQVYEDCCVEKDNIVVQEELPDVPTAPYPLDHQGNFFLDFALLQKVHPEVTSKKALLPFLSNELFQSITIICTHVMPWLDSFIMERNLNFEVTRNNGLSTIIIRHKSCRE